MEAHPSRFFSELRRCGALAVLLPEVDRLFGVPQPIAHHPELDAGVHVMQALDYSAAAGDSLPVRYAVLAHDLGKAATPPAQWPRHIAHERESVRIADALSLRLRASAECRDMARLVARYHATVQRAVELRASTLLDLLVSADALRRPERLDGLMRACEADVRSRPGGGRKPGADAAGFRERILGALEAVRAVDAGAIAARHADASDLPERIRSARLAALRAWLGAQKGSGDGTA